MGINDAVRTAKDAEGQVVDVQRGDELLDLLPVKRLDRNLHLPLEPEFVAQMRFGLRRCDVQRADLFECERLVKLFWKTLVFLIRSKRELDGLPSGHGEQEHGGRATGGPA